MSIVSFVILHYKDYESTERCVRSIVRMDQQERIRMVIVDNDIEKDQAERDAGMQKYKEYKNAAVLSIRENGGFSYANNQGYVYARNEQKADFILVLNNDIKFQQYDFLQKLDEAYQKHGCHVLGPDIIHYETGAHQNPLDTRLRTKTEAEYTVRMNRRALRFYSLLYPLLLWNYKRMEKKQIKKRQIYADYSTWKDDIVPCGACLIFTPKFVQCEDLAFMPETPFFYEEYILTYRCRKNNYKIVYDPVLQVYHENGKATKKNYHSQKARLRFRMERIAEAAEIYSTLELEKQS